MDLENVQKLAEFDSPTVANGLELLGVRDPSIGYTGPDVRALMPEMGARVGVVVTARLDTTTAGTDQTSMSLFWEWLRLIEQQANAHTNGADSMPVFAVIESVGVRPRYTVTIGDGMGTQLAMAGAVGFLTNGCIRDIAGVRAIPLPCWGAGLSPMHGRLRWLDIQSPVVIDGMTVRPGDVIHADENGAISIPPEVADQLYEKALEVRTKEATMFAKLRQPGMTIGRYLQEAGL